MVTLPADRIRIAAVWELARLMVRHAVGVDGPLIAGDFDDGMARRVGTIV
jgi:hypothetical protein